MLFLLFLLSVLTLFLLLLVLSDMLLLLLPRLLLLFGLNRACFFILKFVPSYRERYSSLPFCTKLSGSFFPHILRTYVNIRPSSPPIKEDKRLRELKEEYSFCCCFYGSTKLVITEITNHLVILCDKVLHFK